ncbi:MAG: hypothetical protein KF760_01415 [Candidatus Eremiobacteraeota bacterium]|nr:hypothetical protein [Candidatus Eremiobacteraeota bacterium]MCW5869774.1 hypothetical protein [Candidatus Eremiobacteraeota bacterium]
MAWDVNEDGWLDLLVTLEAEGGVAVLQGDGQGLSILTPLFTAEGAPEMKKSPGF